MAYVIVDSCIKDLLCVDACPTDCIHPKQDDPKFAEAAQLFINQEECIDCGACATACTSNSIFPVEELADDKKDFVAKNQAWYA